MAAKELDAHASRRPESVASCQRGIRFFGKWCSVQRHQVGIAGFDHEVKMRCAHGARLRVHIEHVERVLHPDIVRVEREGPFQRGTAISWLTNSQQINTKQRQCPRIAGVARHTGAREPHRVAVQPIPCRHVSKFDFSECRSGQPLMRFPKCGAMTCRIVRQPSRSGDRNPRSGRSTVGHQPVPRLHRGRVVELGVDQSPRSQRVRVGAARIDREQLRQRVACGKPAVQRIQTHHRGKRTWVARIGDERLLQRSARIGKIEFLEEHLAQFGTGVDSRRLDRQRAIIPAQRVSVALRIGAAKQPCRFRHGVKLAGGVRGDPSDECIQARHRRRASIALAIQSQSLDACKQ